MIKDDNFDGATFVGYCVAGGRPIVIKNTFIELGETDRPRRRTFSHHRSRSLPESLPASGISEQDLEGASLATSSATRAREVPFGGVVEEVSDEKQLALCPLYSGELYPMQGWLSGGDEPPEPRTREGATQTDWSDFAVLADINGAGFNWSPVPIGFASPPAPAVFSKDSLVMTDFGEDVRAMEKDLDELSDLPPLHTLFRGCFVPTELPLEPSPMLPVNPPSRRPSGSSSPSRAKPRKSAGLDPNAKVFVPAASEADVEDRTSEASTVLNLDSDDSDESNAHRTTVMIRNLPEGATRGMLEQLLDGDGFYGCYDFIYVPSDIASGASFFYAFVNLTSPAEARRFQRHFTGFRCWLEPCDKESVVDWSEALQGLFALAERYRNSPLMHKTVPDGLRPAMYRDGKRIAFPPPTRVLRAPRLRRGAPKLPRERGRIGTIDQDSLDGCDLSSPVSCGCLDLPPCCEDVATPTDTDWTPCGAFAIGPFGPAVLVDSAAVLSRPKPR